MKIEMRTVARIVLPWMSYLALYAFAVSCVRFEPPPWSDAIILSCSALLSILSFLVSRAELERGNRLAYANFAILFGLNALLRPAYLILSDNLLRLDRFANVYFIQYYSAQYQLLLSLSVMFAIVHSVWRFPAAVGMYSFSLTCVLGLWLLLFSPYILDPMYLYTTQDIVDFRELSNTVDRLRQSGETSPSVGDIAATVKLYKDKSDSSKEELSVVERYRRVADLMPFLEKDNHRPLLLRPLNRSIVGMNALNVTAIILFLIYHYLKDPPKAAYLEKVILLFLPFCSFELLHSYVFGTLDNQETFWTTFMWGQYFSVGIMVLLMCVFSLRLRFVLSIEGHYYENRLMSDPTHITRWRDAFDNWILRQFMNPRDLDQRFLVHQKEGPDTNLNNRNDRA
jgi:hypothetical protein